MCNESDVKICERAVTERTYTVLKVVVLGEVHAVCDFATQAAACDFLGERSEVVGVCHCL